MSGLCHFYPAALEDRILITIKRFKDFLLSKSKTARILIRSGRDHLRIVQIRKIDSF